jgi:rRNA processing protein Gar1
MLNMAIRKRFVLTEEEKEEVKVLPAAELVQEPLPLNTETTTEETPEEQPVPEEIKVNAFSSLVNASISREWEAIDAINSAIVTFIVERPEDEASIEVLRQVVDEKTAHVGMLQKVLGIVDGKVYDLVKDGEEKADDIVSEVVPEVKEEPKLEENKKPLKEDMTDDYWSAVVASEVDYLVQDEDSVDLLGNEEAQSILPALGEDDLKKMYNDVGGYILNTDDVWERITEVIREGIIHWIQKHITNPDNLTAEIIPTEESLKKQLKENIDYNIVGEVGQGNEFNPNGFWNYQALRALERIIDDYNSGYYEEEGGAPDHIELIKTLTKEELIKICKLTARKIGDLDDNCYDSISESAMDNLEIILRRELENPNRLTANILPESKDKLILKENMSDLEEIGYLPEFSNEGFYNQLALSAVTHLLNKIKDGDFDIVDDKDEIIIAVLPSLNKQELIEIIKEASNGISSIPDDAYDYMFDEAYESVQEVLVKKFSGKDLLSAEIIPEDK